MSFRVQAFDRTMSTARRIFALRSFGTVSKQTPKDATEIGKALSNQIANASNSYFGRYSKRKRKMKQLFIGKQKRKKKKSPYDPSSGETPEEYEEHDPRTIMDLVFPNPYKGSVEPEKRATFAEYKEAIPLALADYKESWEDFMTSRGILVEDIKKPSEKEDLDEKTSDQRVAESLDATMKNAKRNAEIIQEGAVSVRSEVQKRTGIHTTEDLKQWAAEFMRIASDCLKEFMAGYKKGRDDEVERMLTEYFDELKEQANAKPRRRPKRRVLNPFRLPLKLTRKSLQGAKRREGHKPKDD